MPNIASDHWFLRKHEDKSVFGPLPFPKLLEWARSAQIAPYDTVSDDNEIWTKAPMIPELEMDWLVQLQEHLFYGPTTAGALLEFYSLGEISKETIVVNCKDGVESKLGDCDFFPEAEGEEEEEFDAQPQKGSLRTNLQRRVRELESLLLEKQRKLLLAEDAVRRLERKLLNPETKRK